MFNIQSRTSSAVESITVNPLTGVVDVLFVNGCAYTYENVSRRAIINLMVQPNISLGFWVNANCVGSQRVNCFAL